MEVLPTLGPVDACITDPPYGIAYDPSKSTQQGIQRFVGIEKDPTHYATALERITNELAQGDLFLGHNAMYPAKPAE